MTVRIGYTPCCDRSDPDGVFNQKPHACHRGTPEADAETQIPWMRAVEGKLPVAMR